MEHGSKLRLSQPGGQRGQFWLAIGSLFGLGAGLAVGMVIHRTGDPHLQFVVSALEPLETMWLNALQMIVLPLMVSLLVVAIASKEPSEKTGRMGGLTFACIVSLLCLGAVFALTAGTALAGRFRVEPGALASMQASVAHTAGATAPAVLSLQEWLRDLIPSNLLKAAAGGDVLPLILATLLLSLAVRHIQTERRRLLVGFFRAVADTMLLFARWLLCAMPVVVFILVSAVSSRTGSFIASGVGYYIVVVSSLLLAFTGLQYLIAWFAGGVPMRKFAWGVLPAQTAAVATRSSLACLPALLEGAEKRIGLPSSVGAFVLPLSVSTFKLSEAISPPLKLVFLAHLFGVHLEPISVTAFVLGALITSFGLPGIPGGGTMTTLPLYLMIGIPIQGVVLLRALDEIPDFFMTLLNVTADMTVATVVARSVGAKAQDVHAQAERQLLSA